jgi:class 3 adenylate cyclase
MINGSAFLNPNNRSCLMEHRTNRTFICSVLFLDIVEYSTKSVEEQIWLKERFNALLSETIKDIAVNDRIILDTGDGAALGFLGDPEDALFVAMDLRDSAINEQQAPSLPLSIRMGINLGPVKLVKDINQQLNLIGDGINVAQRIMSFADPGKLLVSRSYYEVISCLSQEYASLFSDAGIHADKHIRKHKIYAVGHYEPKKTPVSGAAISQKPISDPNEAAITDLPQPKQSQSAATQTSGHSDAATVPSIMIRHLVRRKWLYAAVLSAVLVILFSVFALRGGKGTTESRSAHKVVTSAPKSQPTAAPVSPLDAKNAETIGPTAPSKAPPLSSKKVANIGFTFSAAERKGGDITLTVKLKNSAKDGRSVALYDASYSWTKSHLTDKSGRINDVQEVYFRKGGKRISMRDAGKTGIPIDGGATVTVYLVFRKFPDNNREAILNLHPFIYQGWRWTEHDVTFSDITLD